MMAPDDGTFVSAFQMSNLRHRELKECAQWHTGARTPNLCASHPAAQTGSVTARREGQSRRGRVCRERAPEKGPLCFLMTRTSLAVTGQSWEIQCQIPKGHLSGSDQPSDWAGEGMAGAGKWGCVCKFYHRSFRMSKM